MKRQKLLFVSHCILNTAAKVSRAIDTSQTAEERERLAFLRFALKEGVQLIQLPCPEFTLYGANRWGHTREQFNNPFFRDHCRTLLAPMVQQMRAYLQAEEESKFQVLGIVGIHGSPSCGVSRSCSGSWGGEFSGRTDLADTIAQVTNAPQQGIFIEVLEELVTQAGLSIPVLELNARNPEPLYELIRNATQADT